MIATTTRTPTWHLIEHGHRADNDGNAPACLLRSPEPDGTENVGGRVNQEIELFFEDGAMHLRSSFRYDNGTCQQHKEIVTRLSRSERKNLSALLALDPNHLWINFSGLIVSRYYVSKALGVDTVMVPAQEAERWIERAQILLANVRDW